MSTLIEKASSLRSTFPKSGGGKAPEDTGIRLAIFQRPEGEIRFTWNVYEDRPYLRFQLWSKGDDGSFWPVKGSGLSIRIKDLPDLADGVQRALDLAIEERKQNSPAPSGHAGFTESNAPF